MLMLLKVDLSQPAGDTLSVLACTLRKIPYVIHKPA